MRCAVCSVQYTVFSEQCTGSSEQSMQSLQCAVCVVQWPGSRVLCIVYIAYYVVGNVVFANANYGSKEIVTLKKGIAHICNRTLVTIFVFKIIVHYLEVDYYQMDEVNIHK